MEQALLVEETAGQLAPVRDVDEQHQDHGADHQLGALADPVEGAAARLATELHVPAAYTDIAELLADPEIDAVVITAPARFHAGLVEQAAAAGKAVFCEKPAGMTLEEIGRVRAAVEAHEASFAAEHFGKQRLHLVLAGDVDEDGQRRLSWRWHAFSRFPSGPDASDP